MPDENSKWFHEMGSRVSIVANGHGTGEHLDEADLAIGEIKTIETNRHSWKSETNESNGFRQPINFLVTFSILGYAHKLFDEIPVRTVEGIGILAS
ncbi:unnamed protein product [Lactuca saligna]|uniref:Uncharacterized protein n=1 Tax=Lactuca saligna TaxID=75948 RepID=A0AA36A057_LACSI|nr:unnamed protein product [Lactuca saligna]